MSTPADTSPIRPLQWTEPRDAPQSPAPKCENCRFVKSTYLGGQCVHPEALVGVWGTGALYGSSCKALRHVEDKCGPEGKLFEAAKEPT